MIDYRQTDRQTGCCICAFSGVFFVESCRSERRTVRTVAGVGNRTRGVATRGAARCVRVSRLPGESLDLPSFSSEHRHDDRRVPRVLDCWAAVPRTVATTNSFTPGLKPPFSANPSHCSFSFSSSGLTIRDSPDFYCYF